MRSDLVAVPGEKLSDVVCNMLNLACPDRFVVHNQEKFSPLADIINMKLMNIVASEMWTFANLSAHRCSVHHQIGLCSAQDWCCSK